MNYNYKAFEGVLNQIKNNPLQFDMENYHYQASCGSVACIAGWTCILFDTEYEYNGDDPYLADYIHNSAQHILGLSSIETILFDYINSKSEVITILERLVNQKDKPASEQRSLYELSYRTELQRRWTEAENYLSTEIYSV